VIEPLMKKSGFVYLGGHVAGEFRWVAAALLALDSSDVELSRWADAAWSEFARSTLAPAPTSLYVIAAGDSTPRRIR
jgi:hypothetical protein